MLSFRGYLRELHYKPAWTESLSTMLFDLPRAGMKDIKIPLSPAIFKRVWPKSIRSKAFHLTDLIGVQRLKKMQGKKKSVSAFYNMTDYMIQSGIRTEGGYVVELEGDVLAAAPDDISSQPDKTGRRWLTFSTLMNKTNASDPGLGGGKKLKKIENDIQSLLERILTKNGEDVLMLGQTEILMMWSHLGKKTGGKALSLIIKDYIDGMEKIMKKYSKPLKSVFTDYTKKRTLDPDEDSGEKAMWDELVVNNIKIKMIHVSPEFSPDFEDEEDIDGFPFKMYDDTGDMVDYINRTVAKIKL